MARSLSRGACSIQPFSTHGRGLFSPVTNTRKLEPLLAGKGACSQAMILALKCFSREKSVCLQLWWSTKLLRVELRVMKMFFSTAEIGNHKQFESCEPSDILLKTLATEHRGRFTEIWIIWVSCSAHETISRDKIICVFNCDDQWSFWKLIYKSITYKSWKHFSTAGIRGDHKQVESGETENTREQLETVLKTSSGKRQGRCTEIWAGSMILSMKQSADRYFAWWNMKVF